MRLLIAGLAKREAAALWAVVEDLVEKGTVLPDLSKLEEVVGSTRPDIAVVYLGDRPGQVLGLVQRARALHPRVHYVAAVDDDDRNVVQAASAAGCTDLVVLSQGPEEFRRAIRMLAERDGPAAEGEVIAVMGAKGGVGATVVAANLAAELAAVEEDTRVVLVDLHLYLGDAAVVLDLEPRPSTLWFIHRGPTLDGRTWAEGPPMHRAGFRLLGLEGDLSAADPVSAEQVVHLLDTLRAHYDHVVVDVGSEANEVSLAACSAADERLVVLTPDTPARIGARRRGAALRQLDLPAPPARAVLNRAQDPTDAELEEIRSAAGLPVLGVVANAWRDVQAALERGQVLRQCAPKSPAARDIAALARRLTGREREDERRRRTIFSFFR